MDFRAADSTAQLREVIHRALAGLNTCVPGEIQAFDSATQLVTVTPAIQARISLDGEITYRNLPAIIHAPLVFPFASVAGFAMTLPVRKGDPCLILFSQRAMDNWLEKGGIQPPEEGIDGRQHALTDAVVLAAPSPLPGVLGSWEANGIELRNRAKTARVTLRGEEVEIQVGSTLIAVTEDGATVTGTLEVTAALSSEVSVADPVGTMQEMRDTYNFHTHTETGTTTSVPSGLML